MQVAHDHHFGGLFERDDSARTSRRGTSERGRAADGRQYFQRVGHEGGFRSDARSDLPVCFERGLPVLVQGFQTGLELDVAILVSDGLDGIAPGAGLAEQVFELVHLAFKLADFSFDVDGLAVSELSLGLGGARRGTSGGTRPRVGTGGRRGRFGRALVRPLLFLEQVLIGLVISLDDAGLSRRRGPPAGRRPC